MKSAFTMIELIFVIVILGILAAVALPKFVNIGQQAHEGNLKSWVGTLNRSVGPTLWAESLKQGKNGQINDLNETEDAEWLKQYTDIPREIDTGSVDFTKCGDDYTSVAEAKEEKAGGWYYPLCKNGTAVQSAKFKLVKCSEHTGVGYTLLNNDKCEEVK